MYTQYIYVYWQLALLCNDDHSLALWFHVMLKARVVHRTSRHVSAFSSLESHATPMSSTDLPSFNHVFKHTFYDTSERFPLEWMSSKHSSRSEQILRCSGLFPAGLCSSLDAGAAPHLGSRGLDEQDLAGFKRQTWGFNHEKYGNLSSRNHVKPWEMWIWVLFWDWGDTY